MDEALNKAATRYVNNLQGPEVPDVLIDWEELPKQIQYSDTVFQFRTSSHGLCYPDIHSEDLIPKLGCTLNLSKLLHERLSKVQHQLELVSSPKETSHLAWDITTRQAKLTVSNDVRLCQAEGWLNANQMSSLMQLMEEKLTITFIGRLDYHGC